MTTRRKRTPDGVDYTKPIALRLMPNERRQAEQLSRRCGKTMAAFAREAYLAGLPLIIDSSSVATAAATVPIGTDCIVGAAVFSSQPMSK